MSYYDGPSWQGPGRQPAWDQASTPRSAGSTNNMPRDEPNAFLGQFEEVERAIDNLNKSGKMFPMMPGRRGEPGPMMGRGYNDFSDPRMGGGPRHHSMDFDPMRHSSPNNNLQNFYANQRYGQRHGEPDQMQQAKRRMAAQRERELRNYHQEQQYNRSVMAEMASQGKSDRSNSPNVNDDERRDLLARQHRALYGSDAFYEGNKFNDDGQTPRPLNQNAPPNSGRVQSPMTFNNFGATDTSNTATPTSATNPDDAAKGPSPKPTGQRSRSNSNSSPASANNPPSYSLFEATTNAQQSSRTSTSSPGGSPPRSGKSGAPAPIGTRPVNQALNKRATPPAASPLSFGFAPNESTGQGERAASSASNPPTGKENSSTSGGGSGSVNWGSGSGVWGQGKLGGVQASVWS